MAPIPDHSSSFATGRVRFADGTERVLAMPLQRLAARAVDFLAVACATILAVGGLMHVLDAAWTCGPCPFADADTPQSQQPAESPSTNPPSPPPGAERPQPSQDETDDPKQAADATTLEQVLVLIAMSLYDVLGMKAGATGSSIGRQLLRIRAVDAHTGGPLGWGALLNRWAILATGLVVIIAIESLHPAWYVYALAAGTGAGMFFNSTRQAWHDIAAGSVVVRDPDPSPPSDSPPVVRLWTPDMGPPADR